MCIISATVANSHHRAPPFEFADKGMKKVLKINYNNSKIYGNYNFIDTTIERKFLNIMTTSPLRGTPPFQGIGGELD